MTIKLSNMFFDISERKRADPGARPKIGASEALASLFSYGLLNDPQLCEDRHARNDV